MLRIALALALTTCFSAPLEAASVDDLPIKSSVMGSGETIIFVHGWTCDESVWADQVEYFSDDYRVVTLDLPGHGLSGQPHEHDFSMELFADAVEAVRAEVGAERVVLVGHSMGAVVIRQYALDHPNSVAGLVAVDGPIDLRNLQPIPMDGMTLETRESLIRGFFVPGTSEELRQEILDMMLAAPAETASGAFEAMFSPNTRPGEVVEAPTLSVLAGQTWLTSDPTHREVFPDWEATEIADTGHFLMMEKPAEFNALLDAFLTDRAEF